MLNQVIKRPIVTEKSLQNQEKGKYTFEVNLRATKSQIKTAIEKLFAVKVKKVWVAKMAGKSKRVGKKRQLKKLADRKKAIIKLKSGKITLFEEKETKKGKNV